MQNSKAHVAGLIKRSLAMAWPIAGGRLIVALNNFYAMWLLAMQGHDALAAGALVYVPQIVIMVVVASILFSIGPIVSRAFGSGDVLKVGAVAQQGWMLSLILMCPTLLLLWFIKPILIALGQDPALASIAHTYFHAYIWGVFPMYFTFVNQQLAIGVGRQRLAMTSTLVGSLVTLVLGYGLAFGKFGCPHLGVAGVGYAAAAQIWVGFFFLNICFIRQSFFKQFKMFEWRLTQSWAYLKQIFVMGWPVFVQVGGELSAWFFVTMLVGWLGEQSLAAQQITGQFGQLVIIPIFGMAQAAGVLVGQAAGAKQYHEVKALGYVNIGVGVVFMLFVMMFYLFLPKLLTEVYLDPYSPANAATVHLSQMLFMILAFSQFFDTVRNIATGALRGLYDNRYPMFLSLVLIWVFGVPLAYYLGFDAKLGVLGLNLGCAIGYTIGAMVLCWRWHKRCQVLITRAEAQDSKVHGEFARNRLN